MSGSEHASAGSPEPANAKAPPWAAWPRPHGLSPISPQASLSALGQPTKHHLSYAFLDRVSSLQINRKMPPTSRLSPPPPSHVFVVLEDTGAGNARKETANYRDLFSQPSSCQGLSKCCLISPSQCPCEASTVICFLMRTLTVKVT